MKQLAVPHLAPGNTKAAPPLPCPFKNCRPIIERKENKNNKNNDGLDIGQPTQSTSTGFLTLLGSHKGGIKQVTSESNPLQEEPQQGSSPQKEKGSETEVSHNPKPLGQKWAMARTR